MTLIHGVAEKKYPIFQMELEENSTNQRFVLYLISNSVYFVSEHPVYKIYDNVNSIYTYTHRVVSHFIILSDSFLWDARIHWGYWDLL